MLGLSFGHCSAFSFVYLCLRLGPLYLFGFVLCTCSVLSFVLGLACWPRFVLCALCFVLCALCFVLCALCFVLCALCFVLCALCFVLCALCFVLCALCFVALVVGLGGGPWWWALVVGLGGGPWCWACAFGFVLGACLLLACLLAACLLACLLLACLLLACLLLACCLLACCLLVPWRWVAVGRRTLEGAVQRGPRDTIQEPKSTSRCKFGRNHGFDQLSRRLCP